MRNLLFLLLLRGNVTCTYSSRIPDTGRGSRQCTDKSWGLLFSCTVFVFFTKAARLVWFFVLAKDLLSKLRDSKDAANHGVSIEHEATWFLKIGEFYLHRFQFLYWTVRKAKWWRLCIALYEKPIAELQSHLPYGITCHPTQVNAVIRPASQDGLLVRRPSQYSKHLIAIRPGVEPMTWHGYRLSICLFVVVLSVRDILWLNGARYGIGCYWSLIGSCILAFKWRESHWPWMTLNGHNAIICNCIAIVCQSCGIVAKW